MSTAEWHYAHLERAPKRPLGVWLVAVYLLLQGLLYGGAAAAAASTAGTTAFTLLVFRGGAGPMFFGFVAAVTSIAAVLFAAGLRWGNIGARSVSMMLLGLWFMQVAPVIYWAATSPAGPLVIGMLVVLALLGAGFPALVLSYTYSLPCRRWFAARTS